MQLEQSTAGIFSKRGMHGLSDGKRSFSALFRNGLSSTNCGAESNTHPKHTTNDVLRGLGSIEQ